MFQHRKCKIALSHNIRTLINKVVHNERNLLLFFEVRHVDRPWKFYGYWCSAFFLTNVLAFFPSVWVVANQSSGSSDDSGKGDTTSAPATKPK